MVERTWELQVLHDQDDMTARVRETGPLPASLSPGANGSALPSHAAVTQRLLAAEKSAGWIAECDERSEYLVLCRELVAALAEQLMGLPRPILELGSGSGELAQVLDGLRCPVVATDICPAREAVYVAARDARTALAEFSPRTVLCSFPPLDAGFDEAISLSGCVQYYLVLQTQHHCTLFSPLLRQGWLLEPLPAISRHMITRHDVWLPGPRQDRVQHVGQAWLLVRKS